MPANRVDEREPGRRLYITDTESGRRKKRSASFVYRQEQTGGLDRAAESIKLDRE